MSMPLFFPVVSYHRSLSVKRSMSLAQLCKLAGVDCRASGAWINRQIEVRHGPKLTIQAEPGDWGRVRIIVPLTGQKHRARLALAVMAYAVHDLVARQSILTATWRKISSPSGRPKTGKALSNRERQMRFRLRRMG